ncbi:TDP-N-acetylfucosamine:lipid II N-acetylfucosaminyltransferase [Zobellella taiwanensis]|uniref:TDP-N-acetylfucosamine:lipid II N-acetylfucosaminyltransferase n=1 Tax=Zobellella taiwanensis TaxID=347535 RepID=A0A2P7QQ28_9GAMM|nr:TDP-N-acetylfucosamine:lipid II N-acetylfucosaminyltransferase [Zobellella taiwanensis]PSJ40072.1 TDP-N-acetylfucosamine:lipid II N-acetylfucosaminyltransferase [Zobellella taiwanensis]
MILHVASLDKFIPPFIELINEHFDSSKHQFWLSGDKEKYPYQTSNNIYQVKRTKAGRPKGLLYLAVQLHKADKVILHGLFNPYVVVMLFCMPWLLKKCYWVMWGGDLYTYQLGEKNWKWKVKEFFRRPVIKNMGHLVTYISGDVELARQWYGAKGQYHECLMYTSNLYKELKLEPKASSTLNIQVGNSADPSNNHIEVLEKLLPYKEQDIKIFVPLSYGDQQHAEKVIRLGREWFGDKFYPLTDFIPIDDYLKFLGDIDIAVFNHRRQQGMGNTITLLGLGKTVYLQQDTSQWQFFKSLNIKVKSVRCGDISVLADNLTESNKLKIKEHFSKETLLEQLSHIFGEGNGLPYQRAA